MHVICGMKTCWCNVLERCVPATVLYREVSLGGRFVHNSTYYYVVEMADSGLIMWLGLQTVGSLERCSLLECPL